MQFWLPDFDESDYSDEEELFSTENIPNSPEHKRWAFHFEENKRDRSFTMNLPNPSGLIAAPREQIEFQYLRISEIPCRTKEQWDRKLFLLNLYMMTQQWLIWEE